MPAAPAWRCGRWQVGATAWGARIEPSSSAKAATYRGALAKMQRDAACIGGYAFKWGWKEQARSWELLRGASVNKK